MEPRSEPLQRPSPWVYMFGTAKVWSILSGLSFLAATAVLPLVGAASLIPLVAVGAIAATLYGAFKGYKNYERENNQLTRLVVERDHAMVQNEAMAQALSTPGAGRFTDRIPSRGGSGSFVDAVQGDRAFAAKDATRG